MADPDSKILTGTPHETGVYVNQGAQNGPTAFVLSGVHGDEEGPYLAADDITNWNIKKGTVIVIPRAHVAAIRNGSRNSDEFGDLNRSFPPRDNPTNKLARAIWNVIDNVNGDEPSLFFSLHSSLKTSQMGGKYSKGNTFYYTDAARSLANNLKDRLNDGSLFGKDPDVFRWTLGNPQGNPSQPLFIDKVGWQLDRKGMLVEVTRRGASRDEQKTWLKKIVRWGCEDHGIEFGKADSGDGTEKPKPPAGGPGEALNSFVEEDDDGNTARVDFDNETVEISDGLDVDPSGHLVIDGGDHRSTLELTDGYSGDPVIATGLNKEEPNHLTLRNIVIDMGADGIGPQALHFLSKYSLSLENAWVVGERSATDANINTTKFAVTRPEGRGTVRNLNLPWGGEYMDEDDQSSEYIGVNVEPQKTATAPAAHQGTLSFENCYVSGWPNNAFYLKRDKVDQGDTGTVHVRNSVAKNCGLNYFRTDVGDTVVGCKAIIDTDPLPYGNAVALWPEGGGRFEDIDIHRKSGGNKLIAGSRCDDPVRFKNVSVKNEGDGDILAVGSDSGPLRFFGLTVDDTNDDKGKGRDWWTARLDNASDVVLRDVTWETNGDQRCGIHVNNSDYVALERCRFDVDGAYFLEEKNCDVEKDKYTRQHRNGATVMRS